MSTPTKTTPKDKIIIDVGDIKSSKPCEFFIQNGYCTLGKKCKLFHDRTKYKDGSNAEENKRDLTEGHDDDLDDDEDALTEICFSFDTTGSMYSWLAEVRKSIAQIVKDLFAKIPNIRISIIAHGDYCDASMYYVLKYVDFSRDSKKIINFVKTVGQTGGGDFPECYELVLYEAVNTLSWSPESKSRALVVIGDAPPHPPSYGMNKKNICWKKETQNLKKMGVTMYGIYCGYSEPLNFYKEISKVTGGKCLKLNECKNISQLFMALCLRNSNNKRLFEEYREQLLRTRQADDELTNAINSIAGMIKSKMTNDYYHDDRRVRKRETIASSVKRLMADLNEIKREKLINISIVPQSGDVFKWHVNVRPLQGAFSDIYIHFILKFPANYPSNPPKIRLVSKIKNGVHPNITDGLVCLPLFGADDKTKKITKYGSSWSAAYSIISLLVNISSIFSEIQKVDKKQMEEIRGCHCSFCGHSDTTPYPPLESNKLPIKMTEYDYNDEKEENTVKVTKIKNGKKIEDKKKKKKPPMRGMMIAGNILETIKPGQYWEVKSLQAVKRMDKCVAWQFVLDWFEKDGDDEKERKEGESKQVKGRWSDIMFGFINDNEVFFGVNIKGFIIYDNKVSTQRVYENEVKQHDVLTYVLRMDDMNGDKDEVMIYLNYKQIGKVVIPPYVFKDEFYPMMYMKDTRVQLNLGKNMELINKIDVDEIHFMSNLPQNAPMMLNKANWEKNEYYKDQKSWNVLVERAFSGDILLEMFTYLSYADWIRCNDVCVFWRRILSVFNVIDRNEIRCFYTKDSFDTNRKCILGVGLNVKYSGNNWITSISTEMDFLSLNSYIDYKIRRGIWGETITHFLPLVINEKHADISHSCLMKRIAMICDKKAIEEEVVEELDEEAALLAITAIMNQFVVQLMASCTTETQTIGGDDDHEEGKDDEKEDGKGDKAEMKKLTDSNVADAKHASEKALIGYCAFHHLLLYLAEKYPKIKKIAMYRIKRFINDETFRHKIHTPDLGKFLLNLAICYRYSWEDLKEAFIQECNIRNVKWYLQKYPHLEYFDIDKCSDRQRIECTLKSTKISRRLVIFQTWFIRNVARANDGASMQDVLLNYNKRWGRPTTEQKNTLMKEIRRILKPEENWNFNKWIEYFDAVGLHNKFKTRGHLLDYLRANVVKSRTRSYHQTNGKVLKENKLFAMKCRFNMKKQMYQRQYVTKRQRNEVTVYKNPSKFEGIKLEYDINSANARNRLLDTYWVNIYDPLTHRWYIGYIMQINQDKQSCDVLYVGWTKSFLERGVALDAECLCKLGTFPIYVNDTNFKQGYIDKQSLNGITDQQLTEEYEQKLDLEKKKKTERDEKISFYHREFFKAVTDNDIEKVKRFLRIKKKTISNETATTNGAAEEVEQFEMPKKGKNTTRRGKRSGKVKKKKVRKKEKAPMDYDAFVSKKGKNKRRKQKTKKQTLKTSFYHEEDKPKKKESFEEKRKKENEERLYWLNFNIDIDRNMTDAFGRSPLFLSCYMGFVEMTGILLNAGFSANMEDINGETALDQIVYGKKQNYHDKESMTVYNLISNATQKQKEKDDKIRPIGNNNDNPKGYDKFYVSIEGITEIIFENDVIDLCEMYQIYPNEIIMERNRCIIGVNDIDIQTKIYFMDESFYRCSILNVSVLDGNSYNSCSKIQYPSNTLYVLGFDNVDGIETKLVDIFSKYGKLKRNSLLIKENKFKQCYTFIQFLYVKDAIYAYNDVNVNKHQNRFKLNKDETSNKRIGVRYSKSSNSFGGRMGAPGSRFNQYNRFNPHRGYARNINVNGNDS